MWVGDLAKDTQLASGALDPNPRVLPHYVASYSFQGIYIFGPFNSIMQ